MTFSIAAHERSINGLLGIAERIRHAYVLALFLIGVLSIAAFMALDGFIVAQGEAATVINVAGRQRMLSQRIAGLAQAIAVETDPAASRAIVSC